MLVGILVSIVVFVAYVQVIKLILFHETLCNIIGVLYNISYLAGLMIGFLINNTTMITYGVTSLLILLLVRIGRL